MLPWYVKCRIQQGMFDDEYLVIIKAYDEKKQQITATSFADKVDLRATHFPDSRDEEVEAYLEISPMQIEQGYAKVVLPRSTNENGPVVLVAESDLRKETNLELV